MRGPFHERDSEGFVSIMAAVCIYTKWRWAVNAGCIESGIIKVIVDCSVLTAHFAGLLLWKSVQLLYMFLINKPVSLKEVGKRYVAEHRCSVDHVICQLNGYAANCNFAVLVN